MFGYGSLVWRHDELPHAESSVCVARGWSRAFYQGSTDHRGVPGAPGRVLTMVPAGDGEVWGRAFRLHPPGDARRDAALAYLEEREVQYDGREAVDVRMASGSASERNTSSAGGLGAEVRALAYIATPANEHWLGPAADDVALAAHIAGASGPSGRNADYVIELAAALGAAGLPPDPHLSRLARLVREQLDRR